MQASRNQAARQEYARLHQGMFGHACQFFTVTCVHRLDPAIRKDVWYGLRTRLKKQWPQMEAWAVVEYAFGPGVHLHIVVKGTPGLGQDWLSHMVGLLPTEAHVQIEDVKLNEIDDLVKYLTKQCADPDRVTNWPRGFHPFSTTRGWCPDWLSRKAWAARQRAAC